MARPAKDSDSVEHRALCALIDRLVEGPLKRDTDTGLARHTLADCGLWAVGVPEEFGGGGADHVTTMTAIRQVSTSWPAVGLAMAQLHAAATALANCPAGTDVLATATRQGRAVGVVDLRAHTVDRDVIPVERFDVIAADADLLVLRDHHFAVVSAEDIVDQQRLRSTGLDGAATCTAYIPAALTWHSDPHADVVRTILYNGVTAVAAGLAHTAATYAQSYAQTRIQFGAPLSALPTMQDELLKLRTAANVIATQPLVTEMSVTGAAGVMVQALDAAVDVAGRALQCFGGYGYLEEYPVAGLFRDAVSLRAAAAAAEVERSAARANAAG